LYTLIKVYIPTLISRYTDQKIHNSKAWDKTLSNVYIITELLFYFSQRRELYHSRSLRLCISLTADVYDYLENPRSLRLYINLTVDVYNHLEDCIFAKNYLQVSQNWRSVNRTHTHLTSTFSSQTFTFSLNISPWIS
jgi:hypothetical protein